MTVQSITIELPSDILLTLNESVVELQKRIQLTLAMQLYLEKKITIGKAAQIAQMSRLNFEELLSDHGIPISSLELEDILDDIQKIG